MCAGSAPSRAGPGQSSNPASPCPAREHFAGRQAVWAERDGHRPSHDHSPPGAEQQIFRHLGGLPHRQTRCAARQARRPGPGSDHQPSSACRVPASVRQGGRVSDRRTASRCLPARAGSEGICLGRRCLGARADLGSYLAEVRGVPPPPREWGCGGPLSGPACRLPQPSSALRPPTTRRGEALAPASQVWRLCSRAGAGFVHTYVRPLTRAGRCCRRHLAPRRRPPARVLLQAETSPAGRAGCAGSLLWLAAIHATA